MLYSEILKNEEIQKRLKAAGVDHVESWALKDGDWSAFDKIDGEVINLVSDQEILYRRKSLEYQKEKNEVEEKMKPYKKIQAKADVIKPHFTALIQGKFKRPYDTIEMSSIDLLAQKAATKYDFDETGNVQSENFSELDGLQKLLAEASVVQLNQKMSLEEIALREFHNGNYAGWLK